MGNDSASHGLGKVLKLTFYFLAYSSCILLNAQNGQSALSFLEGSPEVIHFNREDFQGDPQFWTACEDSAGMLYFGNNDGVLIFDGERWQSVRLPNNSSVRCLLYQNGKVLAGGFNEFGIIHKGRGSTYEYSSLVDSLNLGETGMKMVWEAHGIGNRVIFRLFDRLILLDGTKVITIPAPHDFIYSYSCHGDYYVQDDMLNIYKLDPQSLELKLFISREALEYKEIVSILPATLTERMLALSNQGDVYRLSTSGTILVKEPNIFDTHRKDQVLNGARRKNGTLYVGTLGGQLLTANDVGGSSNLIWNTALKEEKSILDIFADHRGNPWLLLNNGLDYIDFSSSLSTIFNDASVYDVATQGDDIYIATNQGVYHSKLRSRKSSIAYDFQKISGLEGQAWKIEKLEGKLFVCHDKGLFALSGNTYRRIGNLHGAWKLNPIKNGSSDRLVCTYNGLYLLSMMNGEPVIGAKIEGFDESTRDILSADEPNTFWICHGYIGVFRIGLSEDMKRVTSVEHFSDKNGLPSQFNINVTQWKGHTLFTTNAGIFEFDETSGTFKPFAPLNKILEPSTNTRKIVEAFGKTWYVEDDELGYFNTDQEPVVKHSELFRGLKGTFNRGLECIIPQGENQVLVGTNSGLYRFDLEAVEDPVQSKTIITYAGYRDQKTNEPHGLSLIEADRKLDVRVNAVRFEYAAPGLSKATEIQYSTRLRGYENNWSGWMGDAARSYASLRSGTYTFEVKGRSITGEEAAATRVEFEILPFWYETRWAIALFFIGCIFLLYFAYLAIARKVEADHMRALRKADEANRLLELEIEQLKLKTEKEEISLHKAELQGDVLEKSKELANYTIQLSQKKELLTEIKDDLKGLRLKVGAEKARQGINEIYLKLSRHEKGESYLDLFDVNFEKVHLNFMEELKRQYPKLSKRELRLCAFIKMDLTNKEISPLLSISVRGVETARYRIRKKLAIAQDENLPSFLEQINL